MAWWDDIHLEDFLVHNPGMRLTRMNGDEVIIQGDYELSAQMDGAHPITDSYTLKVVLGKDFPRMVPKVFETGGRIPKTPEHHINMDGSFCLGSEIRLKEILYSKPGLLSFSENALAPFLYSISHKITFDSYPYGELAHGEEGLVEDYQQIFKVSGKASVLAALKALGKRKREANKLICPCNCGRRLGRCKYRFFLDEWRGIERRRWFRSHLSKFTFPPKKKKAKRIRQ